jgi:beta-galactosidase/beta-glucuronidase
MSERGRFEPKGNGKLETNLGPWERRRGGLKEQKEKAKERVRERVMLRRQRNAPSVVASSWRNNLK